MQKGHKNVCSQLLMFCTASHTNRTIPGVHVIASDEGLCRRAENIPAMGQTFVLVLDLED